MSFEDDLKTQETAPIPFEDVDILLNGTLYVFRFKKMDAFEWAAQCDNYPARPTVLIDRAYGYNIRTMTMGVAPLCGVRLEGDTEVELRVDPPKTRGRVDEWRSLFKAIDGDAFQRITDALFNLNQYGPQQAVEAAKKALTGSAAASS
jgi:hypothetical protein